MPTPAIHRMFQKAATTPTKAHSCATALARSTNRDRLARCRKASSSLSSRSAARIGMASENATTEILAGNSSDDAVRNG